MGRLARAGALTACVVSVAACSGSDDQPSAATAVATPTSPSTVPVAASTTDAPTSTVPDDGDTGSSESGTASDGVTAPTSSTTVAGGGGDDDGGDGDGDDGGDDGGGGGDDGGGDDGGGDGDGDGDGDDGGDGGDPAAWENIDSLPAEAYPAFTDSNWSGAPSPALAGDAGSLAAGIYHAARVGGDDDSIELEIRRFESCTVSPGDCVTFEGEEIPPEEIAPSGRALQMELALDGSLRVGVSGVDCQADARVATGADLRAMMRQFDADYAAAIATVPETAIERDDIATIIAALLESPSGHFEAPSCFEGAFPLGSIRWRGDAGPGVLLQTPLAGDGNGGFEVPESASAVWLRPSALAVDGGGTRTLYLDAGFIA
jgi:hypothetical protein